MCSLGVLGWGVAAASLTLAFWSSDSVVRSLAEEPSCCGEGTVQGESRGVCVCLFYEYGVYVPPPPNDPIYYYYGMACPPDDVPGTIIWMDSVQRRVGSRQCTSDNCPTENQSNCFLPDGRVFLVTQETPPKKPKVQPMMPPGLAKKGAAKCPPAWPIAYLPCGVPGWSSKPLGDPWFAQLETKRPIYVKLQKISIESTIKELPPEVPSAIVVGHGVQVTTKPTAPVVPIPQESIRPVLPDRNALATRAVVITWEDCDYYVVLEDEYVCAPTKAQEK